MIRLKANFVIDWVGILRNALVDEQGWPADEVSALPDGHVPGRFFDAQRRRIASIPRTIVVADDFTCPQDCDAGWAMFQQEVATGQDINRRLSKRHASITNPDGLLAEWGIHHFHLGTAPDPKAPNYAKREGPLVYAIIRDCTVYAINIMGHKNWENEVLLESIHRNWPDLIEKYRAHGVTANILSASERRALRGKNVNAHTKTTDGTVYMPITGGVMANGVSAESVRESEHWIIAIQDFQSNLEDQISKILPVLLKQGYSGEVEIEATLTRFGSSFASVYFPKYLINANLDLVSEIQP